MNSTTGNIEIYEATTKNLSRNFAMDEELSKVQQKMVLTWRNPDYLRLIEKYQHLKRVVMEDNNRKPELPIDIILGIGEYLKIKTKIMIEVEKQSEPIAEKTHL